MTLSQTLDAITVEQLRSTRALKWSLPGEVTGAFVAEMDYGTSPVITQALHRALEVGSFGYPTPELAQDLQQATADRLSHAHDWQVDPADVHPVPDVITVLEKAIALTTDPGTPVVVPTPAYMNFFNAIRGAGREVIEVPMVRDQQGVFRMDLPAISRAIESSGAQLVTLCNPHNPTGRVFTREELEAFCAMIGRTEARVLSDEIWAPLVFRGHRHIPYASLGELAASHTITAVAASKGWNIPGLKCAQAILSSDVDREAWAGIQPPTWHRVAHLGMVGTIAAYRDRSGWIEGVIDYVEDCTRIVHDALRERLPAASMPAPEGTYVCWIDLAGLDLPGPASAHLMDTVGVLPTDGISCGEVGRDHIRLIAAMPRPVLRETVERMLGELAVRSR